MPTQINQVSQAKDNISNAELIETIQQIATEYFGVLGLEHEYGPTMNIFNMYKPRRCPRAQALMRWRGVEDTAAGWRGWIATNTELVVPERSILQKIAGRRRRVLTRQMEQQAGPLPPSEHKQAMGGDTLSVIERKRPILAWDIGRHCYTSVGMRIVYEVR